MLAKSLVLGLVSALAACAPLPQQTSAPNPPRPGAASAAADGGVSAKSADAGKPGDPDEPEMKAMPPTDVRVMKCSVLNSASDDDKAYASTFLLGYRSAMIHSHVIDTKQIDSILQAAMADCAAKPDALAYKVFAETQIKAYAAEHPVHHLHHRPITPANMAAPESPAPETPASEPGASPEPPPMRYAPAAGSSPMPADAPAASSPSEGPR